MLCIILKSGVIPGNVNTDTYYRKKNSTKTFPTETLMRYAIKWILGLTKLV